MKLYISALKYILLLIIGITLLILAFKGQDLNSLISDLQKANYGWVSASLSTMFLAHVLRAFRWRMMISSLGHGTPSMVNTTYAVIIGYLANLALPRMGEVSRCGVVNRTDNIPVIKLIGTVIVERIIDLLMLIIFIAFSIFLQFDVISEFLYRDVFLKLNGSAGNRTILIFAALMLIIALVFFYILMKKKKWGIRSLLYNLFMDMKSGILSVKDLKNKTGFIASSIGIWLLYWISCYLCFFALNSTSRLGIMPALSTLVFSSIGMVAPVQGGIGAFHWMVSEGLEIYNIPKSEGLAYALLIHSSQTILILFTGAISLIILMLKPKSIANEQTSKYSG